MSLYQKWQDMIENISDETYDAFWFEYSSAEIEIYTDILENSSETRSGTFDELAKKYDVEPTIFMGFLDGVNASLKEPLSIETVEESTNITLSIDFEKLYFNMLAADADHLYTLPPWEHLLSEEKQQEILKTYKRSKIFVKEETPGRNDPCICGSGKKYKKCCGA